MSIMITYHSKNSDFCMQLAWTLWTMSFQETIIDSADSAWKPWSLDFEMLLPDENSHSKHQFKHKGIKWQTTLSHLHAWFNISDVLLMVITYNAFTPTAHRILYYHHQLNWISRQNCLLMAITHCRKIFRQINSFVISV